MAREDKQKICDALCKVLNLTSAGRDVKAIWYDELLETATIVYKSGQELEVNVAKDSGTALIRDVMNYI